MKRKCTTIALATIAALVNLGHLVLAQEWQLTSAPAVNGRAVACSADGTRVAAVAGGQVFPVFEGGPIYVSTNSGATWAPASPPGSNLWSIASSAEGNRLAAESANKAQFTAPPMVG